MKHINILIKPMSSLCDMRCSYCFYRDVSASRHEFSLGTMNKGTAASVIKNVFRGLAAGDNVTFGFQGGEPGLAGLDFYNFFVREAEKEAEKFAPKVQTHYSFQTNGLMIDEEWCAFFKENNFLVGLSMDGDGALHNKNRLDSQGKGTFNRVTAAKRLLDKQAVNYNILCVLTKELARRAGKLWGFILREGIRYIQFIPCLAPLNEKDNSPYALTAERFYRFYSEIFPLWKKEAERGNLVTIRLFEDLAGIMLGGRRGTCGTGGRCSVQIIVEADGSVYPCDFYVLDEYRLGNLAETPLEEIFYAAANSGFLKKSRHLPNWCRDCAYSSWCRGGCKRMERNVYGERCGMRLFLDRHLNELLTRADENKPSIQPRGKRNKATPV